MRVHFVEIRDNEASVEDEYEADDFMLGDRSMIPGDPRLRGLSADTRSTIAAMFDNDVDEACFTATRHCALFAKPQQWALELVGACRSGWKDYNREVV